MISTMKKTVFIITPVILFVIALTFYLLKSGDMKSSNDIESIQITTANTEENVTYIDPLDLKLKNNAIPDDIASSKNKSLKELKEESIKLRTDDQYAPQDKLPDSILKKIHQDINENKLNLGNIGGISEVGREKLDGNDLTDAISIDDLPPSIASEARGDLEFRKKNRFDKTSERNTSEILTAIGQISGTEYQIPNLDFQPSKLPDSFRSDYQYLGYIYPYRIDELTTYTSIKRVFSHAVNNSVLVINETSLKNGGATLIKEFVNSQVQGCPTMIVEKRDSIDRRYGQINWNTNLIGFTIYQFNVKDPTSGLLNLANSIAIANIKNLTCEVQDRNATSSFMPE